MADNCFFRPDLADNRAHGYTYLSMAHRVERGTQFIYQPAPIVS